MLIEGLVTINEFESDNLVDVLLNIDFQDNRNEKYDLEAGFISIMFCTANENVKPVITLCDGGYSSKDDPFTDEEKVALIEKAKAYLNEHLDNKAAYA